MNYGVDWNWFDIAVLVILGIGVARGRKRGMSLELLPLLQILVTVVAGSQVYRFLGERLFQVISGSLEKWLCYWIVYVLFALIVHMVFNSLKRGIGEKLVGSDLFGSMEFYFGMLAGMVRFGGYTLMFLALAHAKALDHKAVEAQRKSMHENFGNITFPTPQSVQIDVFEKSMIGKLSDRYLSTLLIETTEEGPAKPKAKAKENVADRKQRALDDAIGGGRN